MLNKNGQIVDNNSVLYNMFFKRKSFRRFDNDLHLTDKEIEDFMSYSQKLIPLYKDIDINVKLVPVDETTCKRGEYCLLIYSQEKEGYLLNVGYMLEQLDLYMASKDIGACWYGVGKPKDLVIDDMHYVIMIAIGKGSKEKFRKNYKKAARKDLDLLWDGAVIEGVTDPIRYAPSACNSQPWWVKHEVDKPSGGGRLSISRRQITKCFMPLDKLPFYNTIDIGVYMCFLEIALSEQGYVFKRYVEDIFSSNDSKVVYEYSKR